MRLRQFLLGGLSGYLLCISVPSFAQTDPLADDFGLTPTIIKRDTQPSPTRHPEFDLFLQSKFKFDPPSITCKELYTKLQKEDSEERIFVLDARDAHEYNISHIPNARRIGWADFSCERVWMYDREALLVIYCSIGERSVRMAGFLAKMGFKNVRILYGSITEWANQDYELWDKDKKNTRRVFYTDKTYAKFLRHGSSVFDRS